MKNNKILIISFYFTLLLTVPMAQTTEIILERYKTGEKKVLCIYSGEGLNEKLVERYTFNKNGDIIYFEDFLYIEKNTDLFTTEGFIKYLNGYWFAYKKGESEIIHYLKYSNDSLEILSDDSFFKIKFINLDSLSEKDNNYLIDSFIPFSDTLMSDKYSNEIFYRKTNSLVFELEKKRNYVRELLKDISKNNYYNSNITVHASFLSSSLDYSTLILKYYDEVGFPDSTKFFEFNNDDILDLKITSNGIDFQFSENKDTLKFKFKNKEFVLGTGGKLGIYEKRIDCTECDIPPKEMIFKKLRFKLPVDWPYFKECLVTIDYYITEEGKIRHNFTIIYHLSSDSKYYNLLEKQIKKDLQMARYKPAIKDGKIVGCWVRTDIKYSKKL